MSSRAIVAELVLSETNNAARRSLVDTRRAVSAEDTTKTLGDLSPNEEKIVTGIANYFVLTHQGQLKLTYDNGVNDDFVVQSKGLQVCFGALSGVTIKNETTETLTYQLAFG